MASLNFPTNPVNGQIYPSTPINGQKVYKWDSTYQAWLLLGASTGVAGGTYGSATEIPRITIAATGEIIDIENVPFHPTYAQLDDLSPFFNGVATLFTLTIDGAAYTPSPQTNLMVFLGGSVQTPGPSGSYVVTGDTIVFSAPPPLGASFYATTVLPA